MWGSCCKLKKSSPQTQSKLDEAKRHTQEALSSAQKTFGDNHTKTSQYQSLLYICDHYSELVG
jgi:ElaB/YqjD/DUF883 family membrane-anchored ribosome-binding protein